MLNLVWFELPNVEAFCNQWCCAQHNSSIGMSAFNRIGTFVRSIHLLISMCFHESQLSWLIVVINALGIGTKKISIYECLSPLSNEFKVLVVVDDNVDGDGSAISSLLLAAELLAFSSF